VILKALHDLAFQEDLAEDLDFEISDRVRFIIVLADDGSVQIKDTATFKTERGKPKIKIPPLKIPRKSGRTSGDKAEFLVDKCDYVFGFNPSLSGNKAKKLAKRFNMFKDEVEKLSSYPELDMNEQKAVLALLSFLKRPHNERKALFLEIWDKAGTEAERNNMIKALYAFEYGPLGPIPLHLLPGVIAYWKKRRAGESSNLPKAQCLVTGRLCVPIDKHPPIKGVPKGNPSGAALVSFNTKAYESFGLSRNNNAPVSREAAEAYTNALNRLLKFNPVKLDGTPLSRRNLMLSEDTVALFWAKGDSNLDWVLGGLETDTPETVKEMLRTPQRGREAPLRDANAFFTLILSGAQGRSIVRSFLKTATRDAAQAMAEYLEEVSIMQPYSHGVGVLPLKEYLRSLAAGQKSGNSLPPHLTSELYLCALSRRPYPRYVLEAAVRRNRVEGPFVRIKERAKPNEIPFSGRCSLIKAYLIRNKKWEVKVSLDLKNRQPSYLLGRLLATLDKVQQDALGDINATIVDRYYGAASSIPAAVFPTLIRRSRHHIGKLRREKTGIAIEREKLIQEISSGLTEFKKTLTLEEQGLFALGFYHQRQNFFQQKEEK